MSTTSDTRHPLTDSEIAEIDRARAAARARFLHSEDGDRAGSPGTVDSDNPPMTVAQLARLRPAAEVVPGLVAASLRRRGDRPTSHSHEVALSVRLDVDVADALRSSGEGWQGRVNDLLRSALAIGPAPSPTSEAGDIAASGNLSDVVRRAFAGEPVNPDEVRLMAEAVRRQIGSARPGEARA